MSTDREVARRTVGERIAETWDEDDDHAFRNLAATIDAALTTARTEQAERDAREAESWVCEGAPITTETARGIAAAIRVGAKEG